MTLGYSARLALLAGALLLLVLAVACSGSSVVGRWQQQGNPQAGLEFRQGNRVEGELGAAGGPRIPIRGRWAQEGARVDVFVESGPLFDAAGGELALNGRIDGTRMTVSPPAGLPGLTGQVILERLPDSR